MIATCPACGKRYRVADDAVPAEGRAVRCAACSHGWIALPDRPAEPLPIPEPAVEAAPEPEPTMIAPTPRRRWVLPTALVGVLAAGAAAVVALAPQILPFDVSRLGLPAVTLPAIDLPRLDLPTFAAADLPHVTISFPPLDLTRIPYVGDALDRLIFPPPAPISPLRIDVTAERRQLVNGTTLLVVSGEVANPTAASHIVPPIEATLADPSGRVALRWRIAAPVSRLAAGATAPFESVAANYPGGAPKLRLMFAAE